MPSLYDIHDNGQIPFVVKVKKEAVEVYAADGDLRSCDIPFDIWDQPWYKLNKQTYAKRMDQVTVTYSLRKTYRNYWEVFLGKDLNGYAEDGNTILVRRSKNTYVYFGSKIIEFTSSDPIIEYYSPVANSDVPLPFAVTESGEVILMEYGKGDVIFWGKIPRLHAKMKEDFRYPYLLLWGDVQEEK